MRVGRSAIARMSVGSWSEGTEQNRDKTGE